MTTHVDDLRGRRIYIDANVMVYFLDGTPPRAQEATIALRAAADGVFRAVTGDAAVAEVMVGPYRSADPMIVRSVRDFFRQPHLLEVVSHSAAVFDDAAMLRATHEMTFIDALHIATAAATGCDAIITNDRRMKPALGVNVIPLRSLVA